jgi:hypothetical protein
MGSILELSQEHWASQKLEERKDDVDAPAFIEYSKQLVRERIILAED